MTGISQNLPPDPAAVLGAAVSLYLEAKWRAATEQRVNLSECYNGADEFMRQVMRIATDFEIWSCRHVVFEELNDVWPYRLEEKFGNACLSLFRDVGSLMHFDERDCLRLAAKLHLPVRLDTGLPVAVDVTTSNPLPGAFFGGFRIQTLRNSRDDNSVETFTSADDPYDDDWGVPYFALYGVDQGGQLEHITDRATYAELLLLVGKLAPGVRFPAQPSAVVSKVGLRNPLSFR